MRTIKTIICCGIIATMMAACGLPRPPRPPKPPKPRRPHHGFQQPPVMITTMPDARSIC